MAGRKQTPGKKVKAKPSAKKAAKPKAVKAKPASKPKAAKARPPATKAKAVKAKPASKPKAAKARPPATKAKAVKAKPASKPKAAKARPPATKATKAKAGVKGETSTKKRTKDQGNSEPPKKRRKTQSVGEKYHAAPAPGNISISQHAYVAPMTVPIGIHVPACDARNVPHDSNSSINSKPVNAAPHSSHGLTSNSAASEQSLATGRSETDSTAGTQIHPGTQIQGDNVTINASDGASCFVPIIRNSTMQSCNINANIGSNQK
ncbi:transcriptional regulatory protein AlgP-like isoform X6 [Pygocentrus nattereri]|uniref:transcriptional regulatory protein AlgP-like isoform X6 n=1 Tax=Pygocentrus nattereri TaxID=42514 RepID=UPI001890B9F3|nr:transcriptional regulatory protein AlgP-like isoform X6 [Pygocentrus nattereri]